MNEELRQLQAILIQGQRLSGQGTYERRAPAKKAIPFLNQALTGLRQYALRQQNDPTGWRLLSQAEECLLHFTAARIALEKTLSLSEIKDRKDLQRLPKLKEMEERKRNLRLAPDQLEQLSEFLEKKLSQEPCNHTLAHTREWLQTNSISNQEELLEAFRAYGGHCDCEVVLNVL